MDAASNSHYNRRSESTQMASNGANLLEIQNAGNWNSEQVARAYVENSRRIQVRFFWFLFLLLKFLSIMSE